MTRVHALAASVRSLVDVLVDGLRRSTKPRLDGRQQQPRDGDGESQLDLQLDDNDVVGSDSDPPSILRPDEVAVAVLLGRALDDQRGLLAKLRERDTILFIEVPGPELVDPITRLLRIHVLGTSLPRHRARLQDEARCCCRPT
jgi:hypothetical protein